MPVFAPRRRRGRLDVRQAHQRPIKELRGFERILLRPSETRTVWPSLKGTDLTYREADKHSLAIEPGRIGILLGASAADVRMEKAVEVTEK